MFRRSPAKASVNTVLTPLLDADLLEEKFNNTVETPDLFENWSSFSVEIKTDLVMAEFLIQTLNVTRQEAVACLTSNKQNLIKLLDRQSNKELEIIWEDFFLSQRRQISVALSIKKFIFANPLKSYEELVAQAMNLFHQEPVPPVCIEEVRFYQLREILNSWVNWEKVKQQLPGPLESLKLVLIHYNRPFPGAFFSQAFDLDRFPNVRFLHEAALLFKQSQSTDMFGGLENNGTLSFVLLEQYYLSVLSEDWNKQKILDQLFSKASVGNNTAIYFNGLAFKQAIGISFEDLINSEQLEKNPEYRTLSSSQRTCLLKEKFEQIGESTRYKIGSLQHSLASIVNRILYYQYSLSRVPFRDLDELILVFRQIEEKWTIEKNYPIQPRLLLSLHLAESNNVTIPGDNWKAKVKNLLTYLTSEFEKLFLNPPQFDRIEAAERLLAERFGMDSKMIHTKRYYVIEADDFNLSQTYFGSPLEEFLKLADWDGLVERQMHVEGKGVAPRKALQAAERTFNANLYQDHWVQNKAKSNLNKPMAAANDTDIEQEAQRIAANYVTELESHRAWVRGLKTWVSTIPIIGPLYTIEEGIRDKDPTEIICGIVFLGLDAFDLLFRSEAREVDIESGSLHNRLSIRERMTVDNVDSAFRKLDIPVSDFPLDDSIVFSDHSFGLEKNSAVPISHRSLAEQVRAGEQGLKWNEYELIYLRAEDRVVPVKSQGGYFREVNWQSGEVDLKKHLIFQDPISKSYYSGGGLKGGNPDTIELSETELRQRETVKRTEMIFAEASDFTTYNFDNLFKQCFFITRESVSAFNALEFYRLLYTDSPSFRRIFNDYHEAFVSEGAKIHWEISIHANTVSRTDFATYTLHIAPDAEISKLYYVGNNNLEPSRPEQIYLHELLHALTGHVDPIKAISMRHRGPIVYLTDKILSEAGYVFPQQIMYRRLSNPVEIRDFSIKENSQWNQFRENAKLLAIHENNYLDNMIDKKVPLSAYKKIFGEELVERYTVKESQFIWDKINAQPQFNPQHNFIEQYEMLFEAIDGDIQQQLKNFYRGIYQRSKTFSKLFDSWYSQIRNVPIRAWRFEIDNPAALSELPWNKRVHCINDWTRKIYIFDDKTLYLSDKGLRPVERPRQLVHEMVQILTDLNDLPPSLALKNRGAVVQITDRIFEEAKLSFPKRLAYMLALSDDLETQSLLRNYQLEAGRTVLLEDRIIEQARTQDVASCIPFCREKRSSEKKVLPRLAEKKNKHRVLFSSVPKDIEKTMYMIKNKLEMQGIAQAIKTLKQIDLTDQWTKGTSNPLFFKNNPLRISTKSFLAVNEYNFTSNPVNLI